MAKFEGVLQTLNTSRKNEFKVCRSWSVGDVTESMGPKGKIYRADSHTWIGQTIQGDFIGESGQPVTKREILEKLPEEDRDEALAWFDAKYPGQKKESEGHPGRETPKRKADFGQRMIAARNAKKLAREKEAEKKIENGNIVSS